MDSERVVILGNFDGVHLGHRTLISEGKKAADVFGCRLSAWTFDTVLGNAVTNTETRKQLLLSCGVDEIVFASFEKVRDLTPRQFVEDVLKVGLNAKAAVCGYNYSFGAGGKGDPELLRSLCSSCGIDVIIVDRVTLDGKEISSSAIRALIADGKMSQARELLGRHYFLRGRVTHGAGLGRTVGVPTVNFQDLDGLCLPRLGVYATLTVFDGRSFPSVTNVGVRPTVDDGRGVTVETHILDFRGDLYGKDVTVHFLDFIRDEKQFPSLEALADQIAEDSASAKKTAEKYIERT